MVPAGDQHGTNTLSKLRSRELSERDPRESSSQGVPLSQVQGADGNGSCLRKGPASQRVRYEDGGKNINTCIHDRSRSLSGIYGIADG